MSQDLPEASPSKAEVAAIMCAKRVLDDPISVRAIGRSSAAHFVYFLFFNTELIVIWRAHQRCLAYSRARWCADQFGLMYLQFAWCLRNILFRKYVASVQLVDYNVAGRLSRP